MLKMRTMPTTEKTIIKKKRNEKKTKSEHELQRRENKLSDTKKHEKWEEEKSGTHERMNVLSFALWVHFARQKPKRWQWQRTRESERKREKTWKMKIIIFITTSMVGWLSLDTWPYVLFHVGPTTGNSCRRFVIIAQNTRTWFHSFFFLRLFAEQNPHVLVPLNVAVGCGCMLFVYVETTNRFLLTK